MTEVNKDHFPTPLRLNIGGTTPLEGWKILNIQPGDDVDYIGSCTDLGQFKDASVSEIYASHIFEHLSYVNELLDTLKEVHRILKTGGILRSSVPDFEILCKMFINPSLNGEQRFYIMNMIFGGQQDPFDFHKVGLTWEFMQRYLQQAGFTSMKRVGEFGIFRRAGETTPEIAREVERLGFGALWLGGSPSGDLRTIEMLLDATDSIPIATGIVNIWHDAASTVANSYHRVSERHPGRFLLGVGIGHPEATSEYRRPFATILDYLGQLDAAGVPRENLVLAALGPKVLAAAADHTRGAHPYLTTPRHTRFARGVIGDSPLLAPEQTVVVESDQERAREIGRAMVSRYLRLVNYRNNLLREGWTEPELSDGGSDHLVDELVLAGTPQEIVEGLRRHLTAGADHVSI